MCVCMYASTCMCGCLQGPEEGIRFPRKEVSGSCELLHVCPGTQTPVYNKSSYLDSSKLSILIYDKYSPPSCISMAQPLLPHYLADSCTPSSWIILKLLSTVPITSFLLLQSPFTAPTSLLSCVYPFFTQYFTLRRINEICFLLNFRLMAYENIKSIHIIEYHAILCYMYALCSV